MDKAFIVLSKIVIKVSLYFPHQFALRTPMRAKKYKRMIVKKIYLYGGNHKAEIVIKKAMFLYFFKSSCFRRFIIISIFLKISFKKIKTPSPKNLHFLEVELVRVARLVSLIFVTRMSHTNVLPAYRCPVCLF